MFQMQVTKEVYLAMKMSAHTSQRDISEEMKTVEEQNPDWVHEHDQAVEMLTSQGPGRQRLGTTGGYQKTKNENAAEELPDFDDAANGIDINAQQKQERSDKKLARIEHTTLSILKLLERFDALNGNCVLVLKKKALTVGAFYGSMNNLVQKLSDDKAVARITSAGPAITVESKTYLQIRAVRDKIKMLTDKDINLKGNVSVIQGNGPMKQLCDRLPKTMYQILKQAMVDEGLEAKIETWWPMRPSEPAFSIFVDQACVISVKKVGEDFLLTAEVSDKGVKDKVTAETLAKKLEQGVAEIDTLWVLDISVVPGPMLGVGKRPKLG